MELWAVAALWLLWRLWTVLSTPKEVLESILGQVPSLRPDLTVDQLSHTSAAVRWRYPAHAKHAAKHLVELSTGDGELRSFETERGQSRSILTELKPRTRYHVQLFALPRRQLAAKVSFQTLESAKEIAPITEWTQPHSQAQAVLRATEPQKKSIEQVRREIRQLQSEVTSEFETRKELTLEFEAAEAELKAKLESVAASRRGEHAARDTQRSEVKLLEAERQDLDMKRKNELKKHKELQHVLNVQHAAKNRWDNDLAQRKSELERKRLATNTEISEIKVEEQLLVSSQQSEAKELQELESQIKFKLQELKAIERSRDRSRNLISNLERHTDITTGLLSSSFTKEVDYTPEERALIEDFEKDASIEDEWVTLQQVLEKQYVAAYQRFESANRALAAAQAKARAHTKAQAQLYANAFVSSSSTHSSSSSVTSGAAPAVSDLLPSNLFKDDTLNTSSQPIGPSVPRIVPPPSPGLSTSMSQGFGPWTSSRSRDSSIFFSASSSVNTPVLDSQPYNGGHSFDLSGLTPLTPMVAPDQTSPSAEKLGSSPNSPEKFKWARLGKKQSTASPQQSSTTSSFVRRLSFFRKDKGDEKTEDETPL